MAPKENTTRKIVVATDAGKPRVRVASADVPLNDSELNSPVIPGGHIQWAEFRLLLQSDLEVSERTAGKHFATIAPTRQGKTTLVTKGIIPLYLAAEVPVLVLDTTADPKLAKYGERMPRIGKMSGLHRVTISSLSNDNIAKVYQAAMRAYKQGDMVIYVDEIRHVCDPRFMGLGRMMEHLWLFGGKHGITVGGATQAPRWVPSSFYDQSQLHLLFRIRDIRARKRLSEIGGDTKTLESLIPDLPRYNFAYVSPDGDVSVSKYDLRGSS